MNIFDKISNRIPIKTTLEVFLRIHDDLTLRDVNGKELYNEDGDMLMDEKRLKLEIDFYTIRLINGLKTVNLNNMNRKFCISIRKAADCYFSRRNGFNGKLILGYSICVRLFGIDLI